MPQARAQLVQLATTPDGICRIQKGDRVALLATNCPEYLLASFAVWLQGGVVVALSTRVGDEALQVRRPILIPKTS